jgi:hypothetical protein
MMDGRLHDMGVWDNLEILGYIWESHSVPKALKYQFYVLCLLFRQVEC